jgi:hypothetical protein
MPVLSPDEWQQYVDRELVSARAAVMAAERREDMADQMLRRLNNSLPAERAAKIREGARQARSDALAMRADAAARQRVAKAAEAYNADVALLYRLSLSVRHYTAADPGRHRNADRIALFDASFAGGEISIRRRNDHAGGLVTVHSEINPIPGVRSADGDDRFRQLLKDISLTVWHVDPADGALVAELLQRVATISRDLTYDPGTIDPELLASHRARFDNTASSLHRSLRDRLMHQFRAVAAIAWKLAPVEARDLPPDLFEALADKGPWSSVEQVPTHMPPFSGDRVVRLKFMQPFWNDQVPYGLGGTSDKTICGGNGWYYSFNLRSQCPPEASIRVLPSYGTTHVFHGAGPRRLSEVRSDGDGATVEGDLIQIAEMTRHSASTGARHPSRTDEEAAERMHFHWSVSHEPGESSPEAEPMALSFVEMQDGQFVPLSRPVDYGEAFYVEGRLEEPAKQLGYRIRLNAHGSREQDVFLYPTKEDQRLLRSELVYLMWDIDNHGAGPAASAAGGAAR